MNDCIYFSPLIPKIFIEERQYNNKLMELASSSHVIVRKNGNLEKAGLITVLWERLKGFAGAKNWANEDLVKYKLLEFLAIGKENNWIKESNEETINCLANKIFAEMNSMQNQKNVFFEEHQNSLQPYIQEIENFCKNQIPGEWYLMETSQVKDDTPNGCTSIILYSLEQILQNPLAFEPNTFNTWIKEGARIHKEKYGENDKENRRTDTVIADLKLGLAEEAIYNYMEGEKFEDVTKQMLNNFQEKKPFAGTFCDGFERIGFYYKSDAEIYIFDSHQAYFKELGQLDTAYVVKCNSKAEMDKFLFNNRYHLDENPRPLEIIIFKESPVA